MWASRPMLCPFRLANVVAGLFYTAILSIDPITLSADEPPGLSAALAVEQAVVAAIEKAEKSVVAIARVGNTERGDRERADDAEMPPLQLPFPRQLFSRLGPESPDFVPNDYGTGVVVGKNGLVLTAYHVLGDLERSQYWVWANRQPHPAKVKAADPWLDLAVLEISADNLTPIKFGDGKNVKRGQVAITLGNPFGIARDGQASASWGIIANLSRRAPAQSPRPQANRETLHQLGTLIQTDAKLNLGTSGGALVNLKGEMIGLTTALAALEGTDTSAGFAIPVDETFLRVVETLKQGKKPAYGFIGIGPETSNPPNPPGVIVRQIVPGSPAQRAGLRESDLITHVGAVAVVTDTDLVRELSKLPADTDILLTLAQRQAPLVRNVPPAQGGDRKVTVHLGKKYLAGPRPAFSEIPDPVWRGLKVDFATAVPDVGRHAHEIDPAGCVAILEVAKDSPAWKAGMRAISFISHIENQRVSSPQEFFAAVAKHPQFVRLRETAEREHRVAPE